MCGLLHTNLLSVFKMAFIKYSNEFFIYVFVHLRLQLSLAKRISGTSLSKTNQENTFANRNGKVIKIKQMKRVVVAMASLLGFTAPWLRQRLLSGMVKSLTITSFPCKAPLKPCLYQLKRRSMIRAKCLYKISLLLSKCQFFHRTCCWRRKMTEY